jgi:hypothetical protein
MLPPSAFRNALFVEASSESNGRSFEDQLRLFLMFHPQLFQSRAVDPVDKEAAIKFSNGPDGAARMFEREFSPHPHREIDTMSSAISGTRLLSGRSERTVLGLAVLHRMGGLCDAKPEAHY